jgi:Cu(I)/Ag(I) efflux system membrane fusion protein
MYTAAIGKLKLWDLNEEQINAIQENGEPQLYFDILSPITGTVTMRHVALGDYVKEGVALFKVVDLKRIWVMFDAYESDLPWIKIGDKIEFSIQSIPGKNYSARVSFIDPFINGRTRVAQVRVELENKNLEIKPEMFTSGILESNIANSFDEILIPKTSILWTGKRAVVYVKVPERENPSFLYREIVLGPEAGKFYVVSEGLEEGDEIAVNGVFKIDAAAQLSGLKSMMNPEGVKISSALDHSSTTMADEAAVQDTQVQASDNLDVTRISVDKKFIEQIADVYEAYLKMTEFFIKTNAKKTAKNAATVKKLIGNVDMGLLEGDPHMIWMEQLNTLNKSITNISENKKIDSQREYFAQFNQAFYKTIKIFGLGDVTTFYQYCPMANGDKGAFWFSAEIPIRNPYFGDVMMTCGENIETIK